MLLSVLVFVSAAHFVGIAKVFVTSIKGGMNFQSFLNI